MPCAGNCKTQPSVCLTCWRCTAHCKCNASNYRIPEKDPPHQRHSDTSWAASQQIIRDLGRLEEAVFDHLCGQGDIGATDEEAQDELDMNPSTQRPRRVRLCELALARDSGRRRRTKSGRWAVVWIATPPKKEAETP